MTDDPETRGNFWILVWCFGIGAGVLLCGYFGSWVPGA